MKNAASQEKTGPVDDSEDLAPYWTAKKFAQKTGTPLRTVQEQVQTGLLPRYDPRPPGQRDKKFPIYINMMKVREMASAGESALPSMNRG